MNDKDRSILSRDSKYCLVGEAWGFTGKQAGYYIAPLIPIIRCWTCIKYGKQFGKIAKNKDCTINNFEQLISEFLTHWNQKHKSVTATLKSHLNSQLITHQIILGMRYLHRLDHAAVRVSRIISQMLDKQASLSNHHE